MLKFFFDPLSPYLHVKSQIYSVGMGSRSLICSDIIYVFRFIFRTSSNRLIKASEFNNEFFFFTMSQINK